MRSLAIAGLLVLGGCSAASQAVIDAGMAEAEAGYKAAHDREALILKQAPCIMSIGGYVRMLNEAEQGAVMTLCGGQAGITLQDLVRMGRAVEMLQSESGRTLSDFMIKPPEPQ